MAIIDDIKGNSITELELTDMPEEYFESVEDFCSALKASTSISKVVFTGDFLACCMGKERLDVLQALGAMPKLVNLTLGGCGILANELKGCIESATSLMSLTLDDIILQGVQEDYDDFERMLLAHKNLKDFNMKECISSNDLNMGKLEDAGNKLSASGIDNPSQNKSSAIAA